MDQFSAINRHSRQAGVDEDRPDRVGSEIGTTHSGKDDPIKAAVMDEVGERMQWFWIELFQRTFQRTALLENVLYVGVIN